jgi:cellulose biosynthesis protein BcsQ
MVYCVANSKGGAGKSTLSIAMSLIYSSRGRTLLIDSGYQCACTQYFLSNNNDIKNYNLLETLIDKKKLKKSIFKISDTLDIIPATIRLNDFASHFKTKDIDLLFRAVLSPTLLTYDYIVIDTESTLNALTRNALIIADYILIPFLDARSVTEAQTVIENMKVILSTYGDFMNLKNIYIVPVARKLNIDYHKVLKKARQELSRYKILKPVKYDSRIFHGGAITGRALASYKKSIGEI